MNEPALFQTRLFKLITDFVIDMPEKEIMSLYKGNFIQLDKLIQPKASLRLSNGILDGGEMFGVDLPIWFGKYPDIESVTRKIMVIGIDPLRNKQAFNYDKESMKKDVVIGTPYALHIKKMREGKTSVYWNFIKVLSENNFVYLTDIYKSYFFHVQEGLRSYEYFTRNRLNDKHFELLKNEIELIKPTHIITFGEIAKRILHNEKSIQIISIMHPAARAKNWEVRLGERATNENKVKYMCDFFQKMINATNK